MLLSILSKDLVLAQETPVMEKDTWVRGNISFGATLLGTSGYPQAYKKSPSPHSRRAATP